MVMAIMAVIEHLMPGWLQAITFVGLVAYLVWSEANR
jgi:hypothetical protein